MDKRKILIQLDSDPQPSVFDRVVAVDAGADEVFAYGAVKPEQVQNLVHGAIFTRGPKDLKSTALFVGGSDVAAGEKLLEEARKHMLPQFGLAVSILRDASGANTTAAPAVRAAGRHLELKNVPALVLGGTGPVGQRVARLLARAGAEVMVGSRQEARAASVCTEIQARIPGARLHPISTGSIAQLAKAMEGRELVIAAGAAGVVLLPLAVRLAGSPQVDLPEGAEKQRARFIPELPNATADDLQAIAQLLSRPGRLKVAIDLNAVPPLGIEGIEATDKGTDHGGVICYGALGVGATKMKIHKAAIAKLFESNEHVLDAEEVFAIAQTLA
jgi:methylenetetrahydrofolate/methylenetetrahydromethanopterin dehydrogenase (NADP+)